MLIVAAICALPGILGLALIWRGLTRPGGSDTGKAVDGILGVVMIALAICLAAVLFPIVRGAAEVSPRTTCISNANQIGKALLMYAVDSDERMPSADHWCDAAYDYVAADITFRCPSLKSSPYGFWMSEAISGKKATVEGDGAASTVLCFDSPGGKNRMGGVGDVRYRHDDKTTISFLDGHTNVSTLEQVEQFRWTLRE